MRKTIVYLVYVLGLQVILISSSVSATSRPFILNHGNTYHTFGYVGFFSGNSRSTEEVAKVAEEAYKFEESKIGSNPPNCENKCYGCTPCRAIEVPATTGHGRARVRTQYTNYEPEGWKCKCGPSLYNP